MLCRYLRWSIGRETPGWLAHADKLDQNIRFRGCNSLDKFAADLRQDDLRTAHALWATDPAKALESFLELAKSGSVWSMEQLTIAYWVGIGVASDPVEAEKWAEAAFKDGSDIGLLSAVRLAKVRRDVAKARALLEVGVRRSLTPAMTDLAQIELKAGQKLEARRLLELAASLGDRRAALALAKAMALGRFGWKEILPGFRMMLRQAKDLGAAIDRREEV